MFTAEIERIMQERFGKDSLVGLATSVNGIPYVRTVDAYYEDGSFYIITYALSNKMRQIAENKTTALCGEWFSCHGIAKNLGWFRKAENKVIAGKLEKAFAEWINNGHNNFEDENTIILQVKITRGVLFSNGRRFEI